MFVITNSSFTSIIGFSSQILFIILVDYSIGSTNSKFPQRLLGILTKAAQFANLIEFFMLLTQKSTKSPQFCLSPQSFFNPKSSIHTQKSTFKPEKAVNWSFRTSQSPKTSPFPTNLIFS